MSAIVNRLIALPYGVMSSNMKRIGQMLHFELSILVKSFLTELVSERVTEYVVSRPQYDESKHHGKNNYWKPYLYTCTVKPVPKDHGKGLSKMDVIGQVV